MVLFKKLCNEFVCWVSFLRERNSCYYEKLKDVKEDITVEVNRVKELLVSAVAFIKLLYSENVLRNTWKSYFSIFESDLVGNPSNFF